MRNKPCEVRFLPLFEKDLTRVTNYIKYQIHNPIAAMNLVDAIEQAIIERAYAPDSFEPYPSKKERNTVYDLHPFFWTDVIKLLFGNEFGILPDSFLLI